MDVVDPLNPQDAGAYSNRGNPSAVVQFPNRKVVGEDLFQ